MSTGRPKPPPSDVPANDAAKLQDMSMKVEALCLQVAQLRELNALEHVVANGFTNLSVMMEPLRDLAPKRVPMPEKQLHRLGVLRRALDRVDWNGMDERVEQRRSGSRHYGDSYIRSETSI